MSNDLKFQLRLTVKNSPKRRGTIPELSDARWTERHDRSFFGYENQR